MLYSLSSDAQPHPDQVSTDSNIMIPVENVKMFEARLVIGDEREIASRNLVVGSDDDDVGARETVGARELVGVVDGKSEGGDDGDPEGGAEIVG